MPIKELLKLLYQVSKLRGTSPCLIVGGVVRDKLIGTLASGFNDIDVTTGDSTIFTLAKEFALEIRKQVPVLSKTAEDGHTSLFLKNLKLDFSSNFNVPGIDNILRSKGIQAPTAMQREVYSRDFNCDTLLMSLDFRKITDVTGEGINDIKNKRIRTCLSPDLSLRYNTKRIIRVIYLAAKLGFEVDPKIIEWVSLHPQFNLEPGPEYLSKNLNKALAFDADRSVHLINKMNLWKTIPITEALIPYYQKYNRGSK